VSDMVYWLVSCRVAERTAAVAAEEAVPWAARDPSTQACALMYGVMQIHKVGGQLLAVLLADPHTQSPA
jgi:hypothetical protein